MKNFKHLETFDKQLNYWVKAPVQPSSASRVFVYVHGLMSHIGWFEDVEQFENDWIIYVPRQPLEDVPTWKLWVENLDSIYQHARSTLSLEKRSWHGLANCYGCMILHAWVTLKKPALETLSYSNPPLAVKKEPFSWAALKVLLSYFFAHRVRFQIEFSDQDFFGSQKKGIIKSGTQFFSGRFLFQSFLMRRFFRKYSLKSHLPSQVILSSYDKIVDYPQTLKSLARNPDLHVQCMPSEHYLEMLDAKNYFWKNVYSFASQKIEKAEKLKVAIIGMGAIGIPVAELFQNAGADVQGFGRRVQKNFVIREGAHERIVAIESAPLSEADVGAYDLIVYCLKNTVLKKELAHYQQLLKPHGKPLFLSNGLAEFYELPAQAGSLSGVVSCSHLHDEDGAVRIYKKASLQVGAIGQDSSTKELKFLFEKVKGLEWVDSIKEAKWKKFLFSVWANPLTAIHGINLRELIATPRICKKALDLIYESLLVRGHIEKSSSGKVGFFLKLFALNSFRVFASYLLGMVAFVFPPISTSMAEDKKMGRETEVDALLGFVLRLGKERGLKLPVAEELYRELAHGLPNKENNERILKLCQV